MSSLDTDGRGDAVVGSQDATTRAHRAIETVWRLEGPKVVAAVTRLVRDLSTAEDLAHDALMAALQQWPTHGLPLNPGAWLTATAKRRAIDLLRRRGMVTRAHDVLAKELDVPVDESGALDVALDDDIGDDLLRLMFVACHPLLSTDARVALTLRLVGGLRTEEIARAFLVSEATIAQRIVRAKKAIAQAQVPFEVPQGRDRAGRFASVLEVIYLVFNEGYSATTGDDWVRPALCEDAVRLGRILAELAPQEAEVHGLVALMELQSSRLRARVGPKGEAIRLLDQNRLRWDRLLIARGLRGLRRAGALAGDTPGPYVLQAAIAACHARAGSVDTTDWHLIAALYATLAERTASPVVRLNHAVAVGMAEGPDRGLALVDALLAEGRLGTYHYAPSVRGDLLERLGRTAEAQLEFARAAHLATNVRERELLEARAQACACNVQGSSNVASAGNDEG